MNAEEVLRFPYYLVDIFIYIRFFPCFYNNRQNGCNDRRIKKAIDKHKWHMANGTIALIFN